MTLQREKWASQISRLAFARVNAILGLIDYPHVIIMLQLHQKQASKSLGEVMLLVVWCLIETGFSGQHQDTSSGFGQPSAS